jgi:ATP-binding cassette subfamily B protein
MMPAENSIKGARQLLIRAYDQVRSYRAGLFALLILTLMATPVALLLPLPLKLVVDNVLDSKPLPPLLSATTPNWAIASPSAMLWFCIAILLGVALLSLLQRFGSWILSEYLGEKIVLQFRCSLFEHVSQLSLAQHDQRGGTDLAYRIQYDAPAIRWLIIDGILPLISASLMLLGMLCVIANIEWRLALVALMVAPLIFLLTILYSRRLRDQWGRVKILESDALGVVQQVLGAMRVVKAFGQEQREQKRFLAISSKGVRERIGVVSAEIQLSLLIGLISAAGTATVLYVAALAVQSGRLTTGELVLVMAYIAQLYEPIQTIGRNVAGHQGSLTSLERAFSLLSERPNLPEVRIPKRLDRAKGAVQFHQVSFGYDPERPVLQNIDFNVTAGSTIGVIGHSGAGKTTFVSLLARFYDPTKGRIYLDGTDLRNYRVADVRNQYAIVLQEPVLFPTTIAANIAYGSPDVDHSEVIRAAKAANAHDFICALPEGYETEVGDRGVRLSGGERQRISLARAFIKDSPLVILDEPTSAVDAETEAAILDATTRLIAGKTTFVIAHRMSMLRHCHKLVVFDHGRLAQVTHDPKEVLKHLVLDQAGQWLPRHDGADAVAQVTQ